MVKVNNPATIEPGRTKAQISGLFLKTNNEDTIKMPTVRNIIRKTRIKFLWPLA
ncbi:MAG: hypothetical protein FWE29_04050 [Defluviitaleaceae bacterium]|nr:hypothetical protein [Defluviitaleaceae bacterium]